MSGFANSDPQLANPQRQHLSETESMLLGFSQDTLEEYLRHFMCKYFISTRFACPGFKYDTKIQSKLQLKLPKFTSFLVQTVKKSWDSHRLQINQFFFLLRLIS